MPSLHLNASRSVRLRFAVKPPTGRQLRSEVEGKRVEDWRIDDLRKAIRANRVSFPSQVPIFPMHDRPDLQFKLAQLYFIFGWSCSAIAAKYGLIRQRVQQILNTWKRRAAQMGYLQAIPPMVPAPAKLVFQAVLLPVPMPARPLMVEHEHAY